MKTHYNNEGASGCGKDITESNLTLDKSKVTCFACRQTWEFHFIDSSNKEWVVLNEDVLVIKSSPEDDNVSIITVRVMGERKEFYSRMHPNELINKFNHFATGRDELVKWTISKHIAHHATKKSSQEYQYFVKAGLL